MYSDDAEKGVLGSVLIDYTHCAAIVNKWRITDDSFYVPQHKTIWIVIKSLLDEHKPAELLTVTQRAHETGVLERIGGSVTLDRMAENTPTASHIDYYCEIVKKKENTRLAYALFADAANKCSQGNVEPQRVLNDVQSRIIHLSDAGLAGKATFKRVIDFCDDKIAEWRMALGRGYVGIPFPLPRTNSALGGLRPGVVSILAAYRGTGKCLGLDEPVMMHDLSIKRARNIDVGDCVMGPRGEPRNVLEISTGFGELFNVRQDKGEAYKVTGNHLLCLRRSSRVRRGHYNNPIGRHDAEYIEMTVEDFIKLPRYKQVMLFGYRSGINLGKKWESIVDPYWLGLWLGDGHSRSTRISNMDAEIAGYIREYAGKLGMDVTLNGKGSCPAYGIVHARHRNGSGSNNALLNEMRTLGIIGDKHIPKQVFESDVETRSLVLAGIIDTDGYAEGNSVGVTFCNKRLAEDTLLLARSLGLYASLKQGIAKCQTGAIRDRYRIYISGDLSGIPIRLERKRKPGVKMEKGHSVLKELNKSRLTITGCGNGPYIGLTVDGDGLFLLGDFTVVHNSTLARQIANSTSRDIGATALYSLEDPAEQAAGIIAASSAGFTASDFDVGRASDQKINVMEAAWKAMNLPLWITSDVLSIDHIVTSAIEMKAKHDIKLMILDHIQYISPYQLRGMNRNDTVATYMEKIRSVCRRLGIPCLALSQISNDAEKKDRIPTISDLRDSGAIGNDARQVLILYWDGQLGHHVLKIAKNNYGRSGDEIPVVRNDAKGIFEEIGDGLGEQHG